jgi:toxin secretion/phage lysis holin
MKDIFCWVCAIVSSTILYLVGDITMPFIILLIFMCTDYITGLILSGIFKKSKKTKSGGLSSEIGFKGLIKKVCIIICVIVANMLDYVLKTNYIRNVVIISFITNEVISIIENLGLIGVKIPKVITNAIDILKGKEEDENAKIGD